MTVYTVFYTFFDDYSDDVPVKEQLVDIFLSYYDADQFVRDHIDYEIKDAANDSDAFWMIEELEDAEFMLPTCVNVDTSWSFVKGYGRYCTWGDEDAGHQAYLIYKKNIAISKISR